MKTGIVEGDLVGSTAANMLVRNGVEREIISVDKKMAHASGLFVIKRTAIVALGLIMLVYHPPGWEQYGGWFIGVDFLVSVGFGTLLIWKIWRSERS